ncbi:hypothetical protein ACFWN7_10465 [Agromyces sp. NPDC058484]|uniref:hypothetical protein n=1 Tax=Agromyces sp. NPDC058484 TaxID=3346524 RepID=UPI00365FC3A9
MWMSPVEIPPADLVPSWIEAIATAVGVVLALAAIVDSIPRGNLGTPVVGEVSIQYGWTPGGGRLERRYEDSMRYDLTEYPKLIPLPRQGSSGSGTSAEAQQKNVVHALRAIAMNVAEIRR